MKKRFTLEIANPCSENFNKMIPNENGSFCNSCVKNVIDLSKRTNSEVAKFISENKDANICARLKVSQLEEEFEYNEVSKIKNLKYAAVAASILIASNAVGQQKTPVKTEVNETKPVTHKMGKVAYTNTVEETVLITVQGKLLEAKSKKPFNGANYPNLTLAINGSEKTAKINSKTGEFSIPVKVLKKNTTLMITITGDDHYLSKSIPFDMKMVKNNRLIQNILVAEEEFPKIYIAGGLGINYDGK